MTDAPCNLHPLPQKGPEGCSFRSKPLFPVSLFQSGIQILPVLGETCPCMVYLLFYKILSSAWKMRHQHNSFSGAPYIKHTLTYLSKSFHCLGEGDFIPVLNEMKAKLELLSNEVKGVMKHDFTCLHLRNHAMKVIYTWTMTSENTKLGQVYIYIRGQ